MPPKVNPAELKIIQVKVFGGEAGPASTLAPKLGPLGLNAKKIGEDIIKIGGEMKGIRQMIQLKVQNRQAEISVMPTSSTLLIKQLGVLYSFSYNFQQEPPRDRKKVKNVKHNGNLTLDQVKKVAKLMEHKSLAKTFTGTVKCMLGTCQSIGCTVDSQPPKELIQKINNGELLLE